MAPDIAVVIVTYNSQACVTPLLDSINTATRQHRALIIAVDNGSTDDTVALLRAQGGCTVIEQPNLGYAAGINRALREVPEGVPALILNPDLIVDENCVDGLLAAQLDSDAGIVVPMVHGGDDSLHLSLRREPTLLRAAGLNFTGRAAFSEYITDPAEYQRPQTVDWALGAAMLIAPRCRSVVGSWDESYFLYSEETDYCSRARNLGFLTRYEPAAKVVHSGGGSGQNNQTHAMLILNRVRYYARRHRAPAAWAYFALTILSESTWILRGHRQSVFSIVTLLRPRRRPEQLGLNGHILPR